MSGSKPSSYISEILNEEHDVGGFECGKPGLDEWLRRSAASSDGRNITRTHVWTQRNDKTRAVVAYFTTMPYLIERETLGKSEGRGLSDHVPCYLLARLALDQSLHGRQLGTVLLAEALRRMAVSAAGVGGRLIVVDAIDDDAASFYQRHGFEPLPKFPSRLTLRMKDLLKALPDT
ncbi:MAG: GNAT family N-acetyltransferase [Microthrixaceae bacterium]